MKKLLAMLICLMLIATLMAGCRQDTEDPVIPGGPSGDIADVTDAPSQSDGEQTDAPVPPAGEQPPADDEPEHESARYEGSACSDTGTYLNLRADWVATKAWGEEDYTVKVDLYLEHYSIYLSAREGLSLGVNNSVLLYNTDVISCEEDDVLRSTLLTSYEIRIDAEKLQTEGFSIEAQLPFNGIYAGKNISVISLGEIVRPIQ